jgi:Mn-dependent DtxR family transcriptional regulator
VAKELNITRGSASLTLKSLKQKGLVLEDENRFLLLSEKGQFIADSVRGKKYVMKKLLSQLLGVPAEQADIDTCKIEHLLSDCTAQRSALFLRFLDSDDPRIAAFIDAWREYNLPCRRNPAECPACDLDCMDVMYKENR